MDKEIEAVDGIEILSYGSSDFHRLLSDDNIGYNAENLTIVVLSCNRVNATIKLLKSIEKNCKDFKGKVLIADNGSTKESLTQLKKAIEDSSLEIELLEYGQNIGVSRGRNEAVKHVKTSWIMFLDNDIYFIKEMFKEIQKSISKLGCKFLNIPLLDIDQKTIFSFGGHLYCTDLGDSIHIGCGSTFKQIEVENTHNLKDCLATFLFGGSSIVNKQAFLNCGGFDENMFIGFEDIDFSIKVFQNGYKIRCCKEIGLVHEHVKPENEDDKDYEKKRFSNEKIFESAMYFQNKYGLVVWSKGIEDWLKQREKDIGIEKKEEQGQENKEKKEKEVKKKIRLIVDSRDWALDHIAKQIEKNLSNDFEFKIVYMEDMPDQNLAYLFYACKDCDIIHFLWRGFLNFINSDFLKSYLEYYGRGKNAFVEEVFNKHYITMGVYDHKYLDEEFDVTKRVTDIVKNYTVSSKKLLDIYNNLPDIKKPTCEITDGVDLKLFKPKKLERFNNLHGNAKQSKVKIVLGWVGNSNWSGQGKSDYKGINTIIKVAVKELQDEGYNIELLCTDKFEKMIPHEQMPDYYSKIHVCMCASVAEGTPNPVLEAMACGVPVVSTDVGIVTEVLGKKQQKYVVEKRTVKDFKAKLVELLSNLDELKQLSDENLESIKDWSWEQKAQDFKKFFEKCLEEKNS